MSESEYKPTLEENSFADAAIGTCSLMLENNRDGSYTTAVSLLVRPMDTRGDESGRLDGKFIQIFITREELRAMLAAADEDWERQQRYSPCENKPDEMARIAHHLNEERAARTRDFVNAMGIDWTLQTR